jgi:CubicO group peptidase (beta-lactamase class C family)
MSAFDAYVHADSIVGAATLVMRDGRVLAHHETGFADRALGQRVDTNTIFHWGSITKTLTAIAVMQLVERGRLSLDARVTEYIPELRGVHDAWGSMDSVTVQMLLSHASGLQNGTWPWTQGRPWEPFEPTTWEQLVAMMPYQEVAFKPGTRYSYSNPGFIYLARIVQALSGDPWEAYVQKNIFTPLGLTRSYFNATPWHLAEYRSNNYFVERDSARMTRSCRTRRSNACGGPAIRPIRLIPRASGWQRRSSCTARAMRQSSGTPGARPGSARSCTGIL